MMRLIERLAARLGFYRRPPSELIVFFSQVDADRAGFVGQHHPAYSHLQAWWPELGVRGLCARPVQRITVSRDMLHCRTNEGRLIDLLRARQKVFGDQAMWVSL